MKKDVPTAILIALLVMFACGALLTYPLNPNEFNARATTDGTTITVEMNSTIESAYTVFSIELKNSGHQRELLYYYDDSYESPVSTESQQDRISEIEKQLNYLSMKGTIINAASLYSILQDTSNATEHMILVPSGAFPSNVYSYDGTVTTLDLVKPWMEAGGVILWYSNYEFGYYSAPPKEDFVDWETNQPLENSHYNLEFDDSISYASDRSDISAALTTTQNICDTYSVKGTSSNIKNLGYVSEDGRYSIAQVEYGNGCVIINGGSWTDDMSMAKIIASAVYDWMDYSQENKSGTFKGSLTLEFNDTGSIDAVFVYMGTITPRYGELLLL